MNASTGNTGTGRWEERGAERAAEAAQIRGLAHSLATPDDVPTRMGDRYDALFWHPRTEALRPLHHEYQPGEPEFETEPTGV